MCGCTNSLGFNMYIKLFIIGNILLRIYNAEIVPHHGEIIFPSRPAYLRMPMFSRADAPNWYPGNGKSFIDLSHLSIGLVCQQNSYQSTGPPPPRTVTDSNSCVNATFQILVFEAPTIGDTWQSYWPDDTYCCTKENQENAKCKPNQLIVPPRLPGAFQSELMIGPNMEYSLKETPLAYMPIKKTGMYIILMAVCDKDSSPVFLDGPMESMNPYGYLPADEFSNLPFYGVISCTYVIIGIVWIILCVAHRKELLPLQIWISAVIALGLTETTLLFAHYLDWNDNGIPSTAITILALLFGVSKRAVSRVLVLMVSQGYGVVRPSLGDDMKRVLYLGGSYFILSVVHTLAANAPPNSHIVGDEREFADLISLVDFMILVIDATFYTWILSSLTNIMLSLKSRNQTAKLALYASFRSVLILALALSCIWIVYSVTLIYGRRIEVTWKTTWTADASWEVVYVIIFIAIAHLWAPSRNSQRYAYSTELSQFDDNNEEDREEVERRLLNSHVLGFTDALDAEYGGPLASDDDNPFIGTGALDPAMAILKKA